MGCPQSDYSVCPRPFCWFFRFSGFLVFLCLMLRVWIGTLFQCSGKSFSRTTNLCLFVHLSVLHIPKTPTPITLQSFHLTTSFHTKTTIHHTNTSFWFPDFWAFQLVLKESQNNNCSGSLSTLHVPYPILNHPLLPTLTQTKYFQYLFGGKKYFSVLLLWHWQQRVLSTVEFWKYTPARQAL